MSSSDSSRDVVLERLAAEFVERHRNGERPPLSEYTARHPELASDIRDLFPALVQIESLKPAADATGDFAPSALTSDGSKLERLGDYRILREIGRGGMGVVYEAEQESLGRHVALKVLPPAALLNATYLERFRREAKAAAKLHHTNIVPVFGVGEDGGVPFYAMQFIRGEGLDKVLADVRRIRQHPDRERSAEGSVAKSLLTGQFAPLSPDEPSAANVPREISTPSSLSASGPEGEYCRGVARLGAQVAEGLAYAHKQGVLHRDVKPSNLLLDAQGTVWITDFGLAKAEGSDELTHTGDIVGTLRFMAPERFDGRSLPQSDVYALGLTLYEMLTLEPAFDDTNKARLIDRVLHEAPVPPREVDATIPRDLETIVLKCLVKEPTERYAGAEALADDLRRFLADRPIKARRSTVVEQTWRWCRRNPAVASLLGAVALLLVVLAAGSTVVATRLHQGLTQTQDAEREKAINLCDAYLAQARAGRRSGQVGRRFSSLEAIGKAAALARDLEMPSERFDELRNEAIACLTLVDLQPVKTGRIPEPSFDGGVTFDRALERYVNAALTGRLTLYEAGTDRELRQLQGPAGCAWMSFSPDGRYLVAYVNGQQVVVWDLDDPRETPKWTWKELDHLAFHPTKPEWAMRHRDGTIQRFDPVTGQVHERLGTGYHKGPMAYHPFRDLLALEHQAANTLHVLDLKSGNVLSRLPLEDQPDDVSWSEDGQMLAVSCNRTISVWDMSAAPPRRTSTLDGHQNSAIMLEFLPGTRLLSSRSWDCTLRFWDPISGKELLQTPQFRGDHRRISRDGRRVVSFGNQNDYSLWHLAPGAECRTLHHGNVGNLLPKKGWVLSVAFTKNGESLLSTGQEGVRCWESRTGRALADLPIGAANGLVLPWSGDLLTSGVLGIHRWPLTVDSEKGQTTNRFGPPDLILSSRLDAQNLSTCSQDGGWIGFVHEGRAIVQRVSNAAERYTLGPHPGMRNVALSPTGRWAATATWSGRDVLVWEVASGKVVHRVEGSYGHALFSPDERFLATILYDNEGNKLRVYATSTWVSPTPSQLVYASNLAFSPDSRLLAFNGSFGVVNLMAPESGRAVARLESPQPSSFAPMAFSPAGNYLAVTKFDMTVDLWDLRSIRRQLAELGLDWAAPDLPALGEPGPAPRIEIVGLDLARDANKMAQHQLARWQEALKADPTDIVANNQLGGAMLQQRKYEEARKHFDAVLAKRPDLQTPRYNRALAAYRLRDWQPAYDDVNALLQARPDNTEALSLRARALQQLGRHAEAIADLTALLAYYPRSPIRYELRARSYEALKDTARAKADRAKALEVAPTNPMTLNNQAWWLVTGPRNAWNPARALGLIEKAVQQDPTNATFLNTLGVVQYRLKRYGDARASLEKSLGDGKGPHAGFDLFVLATCHAKLGDAAKAKEHYDRAVKWAEGQKGMLAHHAADLNAFQAEAAEALSDLPGKE